jgi:N-acetylneuraminate synthase
MSHEDEIVESIAILRGSASPFALLHVNSTYPTPFRDVQLRYMDRLAELGDCIVGYSGHERGYHVVLAAVARGAKILEKHITRDRDQEGNDHRVSLLPEEFADLMAQVRDIEDALGDGTARTISQGELMNRVNLAKSVVAAARIEVGQLITRELLDVRSPGQGLQPNRRDQLVGRTASRPFEPGDFFYEADLSDEAVVARSYRFDRPWGLPVRYHDFEALAGRSNPDFLEFHMSYNDIDLDPLTMVSGSVPLGLVVHSPELFRGDHLLDLAADDPSYRQHSIDELQRVIDVTRALRTRFDVDGPTPIVTNLGGFSRNGPRSQDDIPRLYERIADALDRLDNDEVEVLAQTLPPFPWYLGGQLYCNLFVDAASTAEFARSTGRRICLDVAHTRLACNHRGDDFGAAMELLAPFAGHLHIVDAAGVGEEGLQIGLGDVDFVDLAERLRRLAPNATFIPEIWQGHQNGGEGFWVALDRLEGLL